jgi:hypothetical protein
MSDQLNTSRTVGLIPDPHYDDVKNLRVYMSKAGLGMLGEDFYIRRRGIGLQGNKYELEFKNPPKDYLKLLEQIGKIL